MTGDEILSAIVGGLIGGACVPVLYAIGVLIGRRL